MKSFNLTLFCAIFLLGISLIRGDCWETGCQKNTWATVGCEQYQRIEMGKRPCDNGYIYTCCTSGGGTGTTTNSPTTTKAPTDGSYKYGDVTFYNLGMTACGKSFTDDELVAAIAFSYWTTANPNLDPICGRLVRVEDPQNGKFVDVRIFDKCGGCKAGDIDLSPAAFQKLKDFGVGRWQGRWKFI